MLPIHVLFVAPLGTGHMAQPCADQHEGGVAIREDPHHTGPAADLPVRPLNHVVGMDPGPVLAGKVAVSQRFLNTVLHYLPPGKGRFRQSSMWTYVNDRISGAPYRQASTAF